MRKTKRDLLLNVLFGINNKININSMIYSDVTDVEPLVWITPANPSYACISSSPLSSLSLSFES